MGYDLNLLPLPLTIDFIKKNPDLREDILFEVSFASSMGSICQKYKTTPEIVHALVEEFKDSIPYYRQYRERRLADRIFDKKEMAFDEITQEKLSELNAKDLASTGKILDEAEKSLRGEDVQKVSLGFSLLTKEIPSMEQTAKDRLIEGLRKSLGLGTTNSSSAS